MRRVVIGWVNPITGCRGFYYADEDFFEVCGSDWEQKKSEFENDGDVTFESINTAFESFIREMGEAVREGQGQGDGRR